MSTAAPNNDKSQQSECFEMSSLAKCQRGPGRSISFSSQPTISSPCKYDFKENVSLQESKNIFYQKSKKSTTNVARNT